MIFLLHFYAAHHYGSSALVFTKKCTLETAHTDMLQTRYLLLPRDARSAKRGIAIVSRPSVRLSVTLMYRGRISWVSSKVITRVISLVSSLLGAATSAI